MLVLLAGPCGAVAYKVKAEFLETISEDWICTHVTPSVAAVMGPKLAVVFGRALLWTTVGSLVRVPVRIRERITSALVQAGVSVEISPVSRVPIVAMGPGGRLHIVEVGSAGAGKGRNEVSNADRASISFETTNSAALLSSILSLQRRLEDVATSLTGLTTAQHDSVLRRLDAVETSVKRIAAQPVVRAAQIAGAGVADDGTSSGEMGNRW